MHVFSPFSYRCFCALFVDGRRTGISWFDYGYSAAKRLGLPPLILLLISVWLCLVPVRGGAEPMVIQLPDASRPLPLSPRQSFLHDPGGRLTAQDVAAPATGARFTAPGLDWPRMPLGDAALWLRFDIERTGTGTDPWFLSVQYGDFPRIEVYTAAGRDHALPVRIAAADRSAHRLRLYPLSLPARGTLRVFIRFSDSASLSVLPMWLESSVELNGEGQAAYLLYGAFLGGLLMVVAYGLHLFHALRDRSYLYLSLFAAAQGVELALLDGIAFQLFPHAAGTFAYIPAYVMLFAGLKTFALVLETRVLAPVLHRILQVAAVLAIALALFVQWLPHRYLYISLLALVCAPLLIGLAGVAWRRKRPVARRFSVVAAVILVGFLPVLLPALGVIPETHEALTFMHAASLAAVLLLTLSQAQRLQSLRLDATSANDQLRAHHAQLERRISDRTHELSEALAQAQSADRAKSELLANVNHELRTPLSAVIGLGTLLGDTPLTQQQRRYLTKMQSASRHLSSIVGDMLDYSRLVGDRSTPRQEPFRLKEMLSHVASLRESDARANGLELRTSVSSNVPQTLAGDRLRLEQVLTNLVGNAIKFTERGWVEVNVELAGRVPNAASLRFTVRDTGIGIAVKHHAHIFEPFVQIETPPSVKASGVGLGLAISQRIVNQMGGSIDLDSVPGKGSAFFFEVTLKVVTGDEMAEAESGAEPP